MRGPALSIQFEQQTIGSCVAWDRVSNLIAVELQGGEHGDLTVCILEPSCPEGHFLAHMAREEGEEVANLLWAPPGLERALLVVTSLGRAFLWTQGDPSAPSAQVRCINSWQGAPAFRITAGGFLLACRLLETPGPWDFHAAPPGSVREDRSVDSMDSLKSFWKAHGLEGAFAAAPAGVGMAGGGGGGAGRLHWVRPGTLCCAVVTSQAQLQVFSLPLGAPSWIVSPPVPLPLTPPLLHADVAAAAGATLRVLTAPAPAPADREAQLAVCEVAGALSHLDGTGAFVESPRAKVLSMLSMGTAREVAHASFMPSLGGTAILCLQHDRLLADLRIVVFREPPSDQPLSGSMHSMGLGLGGQQPGGGDGGGYAGGAGGWDGGAAGGGWHRAAERVVPLEEKERGVPAGSVAACASPSSSTVAVRLPAGQLVSMAGLGLADVRVSELIGGATRGLAASPNGCQIALATRGAALLQLEWAHPPPSSPRSAAQLALQLAKRSCYALLCHVRHAPWDIVQAMKALCTLWGPRPLQLCCDMVDTAVHSVHPSARAGYAAAWDRIKAELLDTCAPDPLARCVAMDMRMRGWMAHAYRAFEVAMPSKDEIAATQAEKGNEGLEKLLLSRSNGVHSWIVWASDCSQQLLKSLVLWTEQRRQHAQQQSNAGGAGAFGLPLDMWDPFGEGAWKKEDPGAGPSGPPKPHNSPNFMGGSEATDATLWTSEGGRAGTASALQDAQQAQQVQKEALEWAAEVAASPDCVPGARLMADVNFLKQLNRTLHHATIFAGRWKRMVPPGSPLLHSAAVLPELLKGFGSIMKLVQDASANEGLPPVSDSATLNQAHACQQLTDASEARFSGPWRLHYGACNGGPQVEIVTATLARIKSMPTLSGLQKAGLEELLSGGATLGMLLRRGLGPTSASGAGAGGLCSLPALHAFPGAGGAGGSEAGVKGGGSTGIRNEELYCSLLAARQLAYGRLVGTPALPPVDGWDGGWGSPRLSEGGGAGASDLAAAVQGAAGRSRGSGLGADLGSPPAAVAAGAASAAGGTAGLAGSKRKAAGESEAEAWREERDAALGLPTASSKRERRMVDVVSGRYLSWEQPLTYTSPSGFLLTSELRPESLALGSGSTWQLAWTAACPLTGQPWRRVVP